MAENRTAKNANGEGAPGTGEAGGGESRGMSVLRNGVSVLRCFTAEEPLLGVTDIAVRIGLHKSTVSRILATLEQTGLVERDTDTRKFRLGLGVIAMAGPLLADLNVRRIAYPVLGELGARTGETAALMLWSDGAAVCVEQVESRHPVKHTTALGTRYTTAASASVQVFLAQLAPERVRQVLAGGAVRGPGTDPAGLEEYAERLADVRRQGWAVNRGDTSVEEAGVAAPVFDHRGEVTACVLLSAPRFRVSAEQLSTLCEDVLVAADRVTRRLGGHRPTGDDGPARHEE